MNKKTIIIILLCMTLLFSSCIPLRYRRGVDAAEYPDRDLPIYDDAIIYEYDEDKNEVTIKYGTEDDIDDVMDFYQDYFDDEGIVLDDEEADDEEYMAEGFFEDFLFEINAEEADGKNEEKVFETTVEVNIEFLDDDEIEQRAGGNLNKDLLGFWQIISVSEDGVDEDITDWGFGMEFFRDGSVNTYLFFISEDLAGATWTVVEDSIIEVYDDDTGETEQIQVEIFRQNGDTMAYWTASDGIYTLKKVDKDDFLENTDGGLDDLFDDDDDDEVDVNIAGLADQVILEQNGIKITTKGFEETYYSLDLKILIENTSDIKVDIDPVYIIVNGYSLQEAYMVGTVDPNSKLNTELRFDIDELEMCGINEIVDIEIVFDLVDYDTWDDIATSDVINLKTNSNFVQTYDSTGLVMVNEQGVKIVLKQYVVPDDDYNSPYFVFYIENNTDEPINVDVDEEKVNGFMISTMMYGTIQPGTIGVVDMKFFSSDLEDNAIEDIEDVEVKFKVRNESEWTYIIETDIMSLPMD